MSGNGTEVPPFPDVELIRRAAALMREDADRRWWVVAGWLDVGANPYACVHRAPMLAVAQAYLRKEGETSNE